MICAGQPTAKARRGGGMGDVYRKLQHTTTTDAAYTWWSNRGQAYAKNVGLVAGRPPGDASAGDPGRK